MADRMPTDLELEGALRDLASRYPYPVTPNLTIAVRTRLLAQPSLRPASVSAWRRPWRLALVAAVVLVAVCAAALLNPGSRDAIAHFFHVRGVTVVRVNSPAPVTSPLTPLFLGQQTTLAQAKSAVQFPVAFPPQLGQPDGVYVDQSVPGGEVALAYKPRPGIPLVGQTGLGLLLTEFRGDLIPGLIIKQVGPGTTVEEVSVNDDPGWWIAGQPHDVMLSDRIETLRLAANTLIWEHAGVTYRIESGLGKADTMRLAAGLP